MSVGQPPDVCLDEEAVLGYPTGDADTDDVVDAHLARCGSCRKLVQMAARPSGALSQTAASEPGGTTDDAVTMPTTEAMLGSRPAARLEEGDRVGRYQILAPLGAGGMGVVYAAYDPQLERRVALKLLHRATGARAAQHLVREGRTIARLSHPNVVAVYDLDQADDQWFVAMELAVGGTLLDWMQAASRTPAQVIAMYVGAGRGLAAAHAAGLVHRDFKPSNVLVGDDERPRVSDFGLAVPDDEATASSRPSAKGRPAGTPAYMAPEQIDGGATDARADQFSFALALAEALDGQRPFTGHDLPSLRASIAAGPRPFRASLPRGVAVALRRALSESPRDRFPTMEALLRALVPPRRRRWILAALGAALLAGGVATKLVFVPAEHASTCTGLGGGLEGVWDAAREAQMTRAFTATGVTGASDTARMMSSGLDRYAATWVAARVDTCEAAQVRRDQTAPQQALRTVCLDERLAELRAVTDLLVAPDHEIVSNAHTLLASLTPAEACADLATLTERLPVVGSPDVVALVRTLRTQLAGVRAAIAAGQFAKAGALLAQLRGETERTKYRPLQAEAALLAGQLAGKQGHLTVADTELRAAVLAAEAGRDNRIAASAWLELVRIRSRRMDLTGANDALEHATATVERLGADVDANADLAYARSVVLRGNAHYVEARTALEETLRLLQRSRLDRPVHAQRVQLELADAITELGEPDIGARMADAAMAQLRRLLGPLHPELASSLVVAAQTAGRRLDLPATVALLAEAERILLATVGANHPQYGQLLLVRAHQLYEGEHYAEALAALARARAVFTHRDYDDLHLLADLDRLVALAASRNHEPKRARAALAQALAQFELAGGPDSVEVIRTRALEPWLAIDEQDLAAAETSARASLALSRRLLGDAHSYTADAARTLAVVLEARERPGDAAAAYREAISIMVNAGQSKLPVAAGYQRDLGEILIAEEKFTEAVTVLQASVDVTRANHADHAASGRTGRALLAQAHRGLGQAARSVEVLEPLVAELAADPAANPSELATARLWLGIGLGDTGGDLARARALVTTARAALGTDDPSAATMADRWLRAHPK